MGDMAPRRRPVGGPARRAAGALAALVLAGVPGAAAGAGIVAGPDGAMWFAAGERIGRVTTDGRISSFAAAGPRSAVGGVAAAPDGAVWFTDTRRRAVGRVAQDGALTRFPVADGGPPLGDIAAGADGNLWVVADDLARREAGRIGRVTTSGAVTWFAAGTAPGSGLLWITAGPDGNVWFTAASGRRIGRVSPDGQVTEHPVAAGVPVGITAGPDGALWFGLIGAGRAPNAVGRVTPDGAMTRVPLPRRVVPLDIATGPDGALWVTGVGGEVARVAPSGGGATVFPAHTEPSEDGMRIAAGPDGNLWLSEPGRVGRLTPSGVRSSFPAAPVVLAVRRVRGGRAARVTLRCPPGELVACRARVLLEGHGRRLAVARRLVLTPGRRVHASVALPRPWARALARGRLLRLRTVVAPRPAPGSAPFPGGAAVVRRAHVLRP
ncbi:virginiamycin B lyase family protein [Miltoncostaea marina]|uniref:Vgb family protein n=1 Tax=Miltoncostaea marina TaxID=2843215 RepID=UPI001C3D67A4|nr:hypothetical protein [Miltoncostaea marina]